MVRRYLDMVAEPARRNPDATAVVAGDHRISFSELDDRVGRLGSALRSLGCTPGDRVALLAKNELEYIEIQGACVRSGFTLVPLNNRLARPELAYILNDCSPTVFIVGRGEEERARDLAPDVGDPVLVGLGEPQEIASYDQLLADASPDPDADPWDLDLNTTILYTSGTTGRPKGAMIDRAGFTARVMVNAIETEVSPEDIFQISLPMFHIAAFLVYGYTWRGAATVMLDQFTPSGCLELLERERATGTVLVPTMIGMCLDDPAIEEFDPSRLRLIIYGGQSIAPGLLRRALETFGCGFHQQYGMTETGAQTILAPRDHDPDDDEKIASAGTEAVTFEVRIVDEDDRTLPQGEIGEIVCTGPAAMSGYWNLPEETERTLRNGWMHTGDLGYRDERRYVHIVDRRKDMIITGGENVYPREVEEALLEHPEVNDVAVVGMEDEKWGEVVTAVVLPVAPPDDVLEKHARERLAGYKIPRRFERMEELPRNVTGKILKHELRDMIGD